MAGGWPLPSVPCPLQAAAWPPVWWAALLCSSAGHSLPSLKAGPERPAFHTAFVYIPMGRLVRPRPLSGAPDLNSPRPLPRRHAQLQVPSCPAWRLPHCPCFMGVGTSLSAAGLWGASRSHEDPGPWGPSVHPAVMAEHLPHLPGHRPVSERQSCSLSPDSWPRAGPGPTVPCRLPLPKPGAPAAPDPLSLGFFSRWVGRRRRPSMGDQRQDTGPGRTRDWRYTQTTSRLRPGPLQGRGGAPGGGRR